MIQLNTPHWSASDHLAFMQALRSMRTIMGEPGLHKYLDHCMHIVLTESGMYDYSYSAIRSTHE